MSMRREAANWLAGAEYDLETAGYMFDSGRHIYTVFMCHLALEKAIKAGVEEATGEVPPRSHDLQYLLGLAGIQVDDNASSFIAELTNLSVATRYPVDFEQAVADFSSERAEEVLTRTKEVFGWIKKQIVS